MGICNTIVAAGLHLASIHTPSHYQTVETSRPAQSPTAGAQSSTAVSVTRVVDRRYNNVNPGLYARCDSGLQVGGYYNSERNFTGYVAYRSEEQTYELQSLMRISYAVFCLKKKKNKQQKKH